jgi:endonuclease/exonuclease/phosphatase family metal-dependent hydrolase
MESDDKRFCQIRSLMKRLRKHVVDYYYDDYEHHHEERHLREKDPSIIMAGDFNMLPNNPMYHLLSTGELPKEIEQQITKGKKKIQKLPFLPFNDINRNNYRVTEESRNNGGGGAASPTVRLAGTSGQSSAETKQQQITLEEQEDQLLGMTFAGGCVLDYIWVSDRFYHKNSQPQIEPCIVDAKANLRESYSWPSRDHPSDHLPIGAYFSLS